MQTLKDKHVLLCVTGGIAAFKAAELARMLSKQGAQVRVVMTQAATRFVTPLTFQALSGHPVMIDLFDQQQESQISHIEAARWADCILVAPATANLIGKIGNGIADDLVSTIILAARCNIVIAPAMNWAMWQNEMVQANLAKIRAVSRYHIVHPQRGEMACGETGEGRLQELDWIQDAVQYAVREEKDLAGELVLVTAGPTYEDIDPVRYVANRSSGKMGYAVAREARARGARVLLVSGPVKLRPPYDVDVVSVRSAQQMLDEVLSHYASANVIIKAAAVADYRPTRSSDTKIHKDSKDFNLDLSRTVDILRELGRRKKRSQFLVGFAAETHQVMQSGKKKLREKNLDLIVVNDVSQEGAGFEVDTNIVHIIDRKGHVESLPVMDKGDVSTELFETIQSLRASSTRRPINGSDNRSHSSSRGSRGGRNRSRSNRNRNRNYDRDDSRQKPADNSGANSNAGANPPDKQTQPAPAPSQQSQPASKQPQQQAQQSPQQQPPRQQQQIQQRPLQHSKPDTEIKQEQASKAPEQDKAPVVKEPQPQKVEDKKETKSVEPAAKPAENKEQKTEPKQLKEETDSKNAKKDSAPKEMASSDKEKDASKEPSKEEEKAAPAKKPAARAKRTRSTSTRSSSTRSTSTRSSSTRGTSTRGRKTTAKKTDDQVKETAAKEPSTSADKAAEKETAAKESKTQKENESA